MLQFSPQFHHSIDHHTREITVSLMSAAAHGDAEPPFLEWLVSTNVFNIALVLIVLGWAINKFNLFGIFPQQQEKIRNEVDALEAQRRQAEAELADLKKRTANLSGEIDEIMTQATKSAEAMSSQIIADAQSQAGKIIETSQKRIAIEEKAAVQQLQAKLLTEAVYDSREQLTHTPEAEKRQSVETFLYRLPAMVSN